MAAAVCLAVGGLSILMVFFAVYQPQTCFVFAVMIGLPLIIYGAISLLELITLGAKRDQMQNQQLRRRQAPRVLQMSRALYEQLDRDMLQLLMSNRDFDSNDYERLMQLEALNENRCRGRATARQIQQLPIITLTERMLKTSENASCTVCLSAFQVDSRVRMMPCFHRFHPECIDPWLYEKGSCPICKFPAFA